MFRLSRWQGRQALVEDCFSLSAYYFQTNSLRGRLLYLLPFLLPEKGKERKYLVVSLSFHVPVCTYLIWVWGRGIPLFGKKPWWFLLFQRKGRYILAESRKGAEVNLETKASWNWRTDVMPHSTFLISPWGLAILALTCLLFCGPPPSSLSQTSFQTATSFAVWSFPHSFLHTVWCDNLVTLFSKRRKEKK